MKFLFSGTLFVYFAYYGRGDFVDNRQKKIAFLGILLLGCLATSWLSSSDVTKKQAPPSLATKQAWGSDTKEHKKKTIEVYVSGAVREPGLYTLPQGARTTEALEAAGGLREDARAERVNLAKKLKDGSHVYVPVAKNNAKRQYGSSEVDTKNKMKRDGSGLKALGKEAYGLVPSSWGSEGNKLNLNTATQQELIALPGIGPAMATRIIALRNVRRFTKVEDLLQVRGIGAAKLEKLRPLVKAE